MTRAWFTMFILGLSISGAVAQTTAPWGFCLRPVLPNVDTPALSAAARLTEMEQDGRRVSLRELSLAGRVAEPVSVGATLRQTRAHGRNVNNRYRADGWRAWGALCPVMPGDDLAEPGLFVLLEYQRDATEIQILTPTTSAFAEPDVISYGGQAAMVLTNGRQSGHLRAGLYTTEMFGDSLTTVLLLGGGWETPLTSMLTLDAALTGFRDDYQGRHYDAELALGLRYAPSSRATLTLAGRYYPRGLPLAAAPLSPAAAVGALYGSSATNRLANDAFATLSLEGCLAF